MLLRRSSIVVSLLLALPTLGLGCSGGKADGAGDSGADGGDSGDSGSDSGADSGSDSGADSGGDSGSDSGSDSGGDSGAIEVPADNVGNVLGDCYGYYRDPGEYPNQLAPGTELQRYTLREPEAVCNDGTRAVMYVRGATDPDLADVWSIHLQGGGGCGSYLGCAIRWCGIQYYDSSKMSSANLPMEVAGFGVMDTGAGNALAGANQVEFYYCSSDSWRGLGSASYDADDYDPDDAGIELPFELPPYTMFRRGHVILEAGLDELAGGLVGDDGEVLPALDDASLVVFSGTSGGSVGVRHNVDWVAERLAEHGTRTIAVADAAHAALPELLPEPYATDLAERQAASFAQMVASETPMPFADASCLAWHGSDYADCWTPEYVALNHLTTPLFVRQDLRDQTEAIEAIGVPEDVSEEAVVDLLAAYQAVPEEALEREAIPMRPGVYGPNCAQHVAMETDAWWRVATVEDDAGDTWTFQAAVVSWAQGGSVAVVDEPVAGEGDGPRSACEAIDDER